MEHDLHDTVAVAQVDEGDAAVVAAVRHPAAQRHLGLRRRRPAARRRRGSAWWFASWSSHPIQSSSRVSHRDTSPAGTVFWTPSARRRRVTTSVGELALPDDRDERGARRGRPCLSWAFSGRSSNARTAGTPASRRVSHQAPPSVCDRSPIATTKQRGVRAGGHRDPLALHAPAGRDPGPWPNPTPGVGWTTEQLGESVVAAAAADGAGLVLGEHAGDQLERRAGVVVEAPHQSRVELIGARRPRRARRGPPRSARRTARTGGRRSWARRARSPSRRRPCSRTRASGFVLQPRHGSPRRAGRVNGAR